MDFPEFLHLKYENKIAQYMRDENRDYVLLPLYFLKLLHGFVLIKQSNPISASLLPNSRRLQQTPEHAY